MSDNYKEFELIINSLTSQQLYLPACAVCATYLTLQKNQIDKIIKFFHDQQIKFINYGSSSKGKITHNLYRSKKGIIYLIYQVCRNSNRIYYLTPKLLNEIFSNYEDYFISINFIPFNEVSLCIANDTSLTNPIYRSLNKLKF